MLQDRCGGRGCSPVKGNHEGGEEHYRYESLGERQDEGDNMMELCPLEGVCADWLSGELGGSYFDLMAVDEGNNCTKGGTTLGEDNKKTVTHYSYEEVHNKKELRKEQTKVILFSVNRCFKLINDGVFLLKMAYRLSREKEWENYFILNVIPEEHQDLFSVLGVFKKVLCFRGEEMPILYFYTRMEKTYFIVNKCLEDIPQDAFIECDAAPTNKFFCLYAGMVFFVWSLVALAMVPFVSAPWTALIYVQFVTLLLVSITFLLSFLYIHFGLKKRFYLNPYYSLGGDVEWQNGNRGGNN
ncbi:hypothetical protein AK88_03012 [Plasmodium fragile]|uniref:Uncharacterized protein n=1 Tax=Plasmodium fragile TaxID=5857 RepID=A0A0D9QKK7_PLAFR|nr:uncharacterized protein AK88_03012 [Plasmodium fragile]KJP87332.1 hypothetical protein AK88_03012 [Plasmodium fragile]